MIDENTYRPLDKNSYHSHDFYIFDEMGLKQKRIILEDAYSKCYTWWVDKLDCSISWSRQKTEISFDEIIKMLDKKCHFTIIHRRGFYPKDQNNKDDYSRWYLEFGFNTMTPISYYLWIKCEQELLPYFIEKYKLKLKS
jgi:hypothetical protein